MQASRAIAILLTWKEKHLDEHLPAELADEFRRMIIQQVNAVGDAVPNVGTQNELLYEMRALREALAAYPSDG